MELHPLPISSPLSSLLWSRASSTLSLSPRVAFILKNNSYFLLFCLPWHLLSLRPAVLWSPHPPHGALAEAHQNTHGRIIILIMRLLRQTNTNVERVLFRRLMLWVECAGRRVMQWSSSLRIDALPPNGNNRKALKCTIKMLSLASYWRANV